MDGIKKLLQRLNDMKRIEETGFSDPEQAKSYFEEKEVFLEDLTQTLGNYAGNQKQELEALKSSIQSMKKELKQDAKEPRIFDRSTICRHLGKALAAAWTGQQKALAEEGFCPNLKNENWTNPRDVNWETGKGWQINHKDVLGDPMGNMSNNDQYLINPIFENQILTDARKKSVMMGLVHHRMMTGPSVMLPTRERGGVVLNWLTAYGQKIQSSKPNMGERVELKAHTLAGYIPWYDEFEEDAFADLGEMFLEEFSDSYSQEFDRQTLIADAAPFTGAMNAAEIINYTIKDGNPYSISYKDFRAAVLKVPAEERKDCCWFFNETILSHASNITDANGNPIWRGPNEGKPGTIDGYKYYESNILPQINEVKKGQAFAVFMNPKRIIHGNRRGIEIKKFDSTTESLEYGELFLRFRKRDGFLVTKSKGNMVSLKAGGN